jgi:hypothetical protein
VESINTLSDNDDISPAATTVTLAAKANLNWWGRVGNGGGEVETAGPVTGYQSKSVDLDFSARPTDDPDSWDMNKAVSVQAGYNTQGEITGQTTKTLPLVRRPYNLDVTAGIATFGSVLLTVDTDAPGYVLEFLAGSPSGGFITSYTGNVPSPTVDLPYNATARVVYVTNKYGREDESLDHFTQPADNYFRAVPVTITPSAAEAAGLCPGGYMPVQNSGELPTRGRRVTGMTASATNELYYLFYSCTETVALCGAAQFDPPDIIRGFSGGINYQSTVGHTQTAGTCYLLCRLDL